MCPSFRFPSCVHLFAFTGQRLLPAVLQFCQGRFWEHTIGDARDFRLHLDYIHINPAKHGLVKRPAHWPWSSFHRYVALGEYETDWCGRSELPDQVEYFWHDSE